MIRNNSGVILISVLWILVILSFMAISLGRSSNIEWKITQNAIHALKARYQAMGGVQYALQQLQLDLEDDDSKGFDNLYYCGISKDAASPEELFKNHETSFGHFDISYERGGARIYGFQDEERKININALDQANMRILSHFIQLKGFSQEQADMMTYAALDWKDIDNARHHIEFGAEDSYYKELDKPYLAKNLPFESLEELFLVRGVTQDIFEAIRNDITIFPQKGPFKINFDTAAKEVLQAVVLSFTGSNSNTTEDDALSLVEKMLILRKGNDGLEGTADDQQIQSAEMALNAKENVLFRMMTKYRINSSRYFHVSVKGVENPEYGFSSIQAVVDRSQMKIVAWQRN